jgi:alpha-beta hydrolase superfamily lysophospholipase
MRSRVAGVPVSLVTAVTRDGVSLSGVVAEPARGRRAALIWVHGLGSTFATGQPLIRALSARLNAAGIGYFKLDTRGNHVVARAGKRLAGAAFERFEDCVEDIRAMVALARRAGYRRIVLAGHSTGANKVLHYAARVRDRRVSAIMLLGPVSDVAGEMKRVGARELRRRVAIAARLARRDPEALVPRAFGFRGARRYVSLYRPGETEDVFPYYRPGARWAALRRVRRPLAVFLGGRDEYLDRPAAEVTAAFARNATRARSYTGVVVRGANHGFRGHEELLARAILDWIHARVLRAS